MGRAQDGTQDSPLSQSSDQMQGVKRLRSLLLREGAKGCAGEDEEVWSERLSRMTLKLWDNECWVREWAWKLTVWVHGSDVCACVYFQVPKLHNKRINLLDVPTLSVHVIP